MQSQKADQSLYNYKGVCYILILQFVVVVYQDKTIKMPCYRPQS